MNVDRATAMYFIRHGESQANAEGVIAGWHDSPLTKKGIQQAYEEAATIRSQGLQFDMIITSTLSRAYDTAVIVAEEIGYSVESIVRLEDLREKYGGAYQGRSIESLHVASAEEVQGAGAESLDDFAVRVRRANQYIIENASGVILIVGHSGFYRMAAALAQGLTPKDMPRVARPDNGRLLEYPTVP